MLSVARNGDIEERAAWPAFLANEWPAYDDFWRVFVATLTGRVSDPLDITFRSQLDLDAEGRPEWHVEVAQLHYTTLLHLIRAFQLRRAGISNRDAFLEAIVRLDAASDTSFELLGRCLLDQGEAPVWDEVRGGQRVRKRWEKERADGKFRLLHDYRNALLHGRVRPEFQFLVDNPGRWRTAVPMYPTFEAVEGSLDWRVADNSTSAPADFLVETAWNDLVTYLQEIWTTELVPWAKSLPIDPSLHIPVARLSDLPVAGAPSWSADRPISPTTGSVAFTTTEAWLRGYPDATGPADITEGPGGEPNA